MSAGNYQSFDTRQAASR